MEYERKQFETRLYVDGYYIKLLDKNTHKLVDTEEEATTFDSIGHAHDTISNYGLKLVHPNIKYDRKEI